MDIGIVSDMARDDWKLEEVMKVIWSRLRDRHLWRHVYKSLVLLKKLCDSGNEKVPVSQSSS